MKGNDRISMWQNKCACKIKKSVALETKKHEEGRFQKAYGENNINDQKCRITFVGEVLQ